MAGFSTRNSEKTKKPALSRLSILLASRVGFHSAMEEYELRVNSPICEESQKINPRKRFSSVYGKEKIKNPPQGGLFIFWLPG